jgi:hypothetical protein
MINLTSASVGMIEDCRFVPDTNCSYMINLTSALNNSKATIKGCLFEGSNAGADVSDYEYGIVVDADNVTIEDNIFQMNPASTTYAAHIRVKSGARNTHIGKNTFQNAGATGVHIVIDSGAVDTVIDASIFGWTSGAGVSSQVTNNGTNTMVQYGGDTTARFLLADVLAIAAINGGKQFTFDTAAAMLYFNKHTNNNNTIGVTAGALGVKSAASLLLNGVTNVGLQYNGTTVAVFDGNATAGQTRMYIWDVDNGQLERVSVGAADSGGSGYKVLRIPN